MSRHLTYSLKLLPIVLSCFLILSIAQAEKIFFPVMQDFKFTKMYRYSYSIEIEGFYTPLRNCNMVGGRFVAYDHENNHHIIYVEQVRAKTDKYIGPGVEDIGTWQFEYNPESDLRDLTFFGYFKCHPFWITEVKIAQFKAPSRIYDANGLLQENEINRNLLLDDLKI